MQPGLTLRPMSLGDLLDTSFGVYRGQFVPLMFVAITTQAIPMALNVYVEVAGGALAHPFAWTIGIIAALILGQVGIATSTFMVAESYLGGSLTPYDALRRAQPFVGRLVFAAFASALLYFVGLVALIVPGVICIAGLAVTAPALVLENQPTATAGMGRSWSLTKGYRWKVLGAYFVAFLLIALPGIALGALGVAAVASAGSVSAAVLVVLLIQMLLQVIAYPFLFVLTTLLYYDLRVRKEGYDIEMLTDSLGPA